MRRAVRDYKYEVGEGRMTEECTQYLAQLQKDWERHRVKLGVEAMRREVSHSCRLCNVWSDLKPPSSMIVEKIVTTQQMMWMLLVAQR
jgi:hypothetical protein